MLPDDAFLRRLYIGIESSQRLRIEALVMSHDIINSAFSSLSEDLEKMETSDLQPSNPKRVQCALSCWAIVDNLHMFRQLAKKFPICQAELLEFSQSVADASFMRNAMDHIHGNLGNVGKRKAASHPLYGFISFYAPRTEQGFDCVNFALGRMGAGSTHSAVIDTWVTPPEKGINNINFAAFEKQLNFSHAISSLDILMKKFNDDIYQAAVEGIGRQIGSGDIEVELAKTLPDNFVFRMRLR